VSPFLIQKVIDNVCSGKVTKVSPNFKTGTLEVETANFTQASKLITLTSFSNNIKVEVTEHRSRNFSKGVIYCNSLRDITQEDKTHELANQNVIETKKILEKDKDTNTLKETGLLILTFAIPKIPENISIGYLKVNIRPYIPKPMMCSNGGRLGLSINRCRGNKLCLHCGNQFHKSPDSNDTCTNLNCINYK